MGNFPEPRLSRLRVRLRRAMEKCGTYSGFPQSIDRRIVVRGGWIVMTPVHERRGAAIQLIESANQSRDMQILRSKCRGQPGVHPPEILRQCPVRRDTAQTGLPCMHVRVDESRDDD